MTCATITNTKLSWAEPATQGAILPKELVEPETDLQAALIVPTVLDSEDLEILHIL